MSAAAPDLLALPPASRWTKLLERILDRIPLVEKEMLLLRRLVRPGWTCLDVGAAGGTYLHVLSRLVGAAGRVVGVEPRRRSAALLRRFQEWLSWHNVTIFQVALADSIGTARLVVPRLIRTEAHLAPTGYGSRPRGTTEIVPQWTLDHLVERAALDRVDLIKCDVEGAEELVFGGAADTIRRWKPIVLCEIEGRHLERYARTPETFLTRFADDGYRVYCYRDGRLTPVREIDAADNDYLFLPTSGG